ncbi:sugar ABC transporter permease [Amnibacterium sp. CER49]|uniref:carbohydrate ABC transporter permease n=1 Tax=Amnibacterium sp. CER49 TaxID=3039161 RepID=UPI00244A67C0|nr:sugar ABC transporter permease [Amnibacterium sp. CER49]MDH2443216.1 sugar ABC transporter permease [Amnibacterium sp. CER49]
MHEKSVRLTIPPAGTASGRPIARRKGGLRRHPAWLPYALVSPLGVFVILLTLVPAAFTLGESFFRVDLFDPPIRFVAFGNFVDLFRSSAMRTSFANTAVYVLIGVTLSTVLGFIMAVTLQRRFVGRSLLIALMIIPWALPGVAEGIMWLGIWGSDTGLLNSALTSLHLIDHYQVWLGTNPLLTIFVIELVQVWEMTPLSALLILATLQNIPGEVYEAAAIDGASPLRTLRHITLPLALPGVTLAMVQALVGAINIFDEPYVLNGSASTGASAVMQTYFVSFQDLNFGEGYALSLMITVVTILASLVILRFIYRPVEY